jgi:signal transduction histidine kinase
MKNQDQTEQLNLTHAVALMGAWSAEVAHDAVSEIGSIRRSVYVLNRQEGLNPATRERLLDVDRAAETLHSLQYLPEAPELAASSDGNRALVDDVLSLEIQDLRLKYGNVQWQYEPGCSGLWVGMHEQWLRRVLRHLARNAVSAMASVRSQAPRRVVVRTVARDGLAEVQVADTGPGVDLAVAPLLFRRTVFHPDGSHGRGLVLVRFILDQHGGHVAMRWNRPGEGTCFAFQLPIVAADNPPALTPRRAVR